MPNKAVLMLAYGSPDNLDDMDRYLADIRGGRPMSAEFVEQFRHRYGLIGGKSPLTELTYRQARHLNQTLQKRGYNWPVYVGMRHWSPWIKDAVAQMYVHSIEEATIIVMAPHYSKMSIGRYWANTQEAPFASEITFNLIESWYQQPKFLQAIENHIRAGLEKFPTEGKRKLIFTAHSLPARLVQMGDPYDDQLKDNARLVADRLGDIDWMFAYQSAAQTGEPWLGPALEEVIVELARTDYRQILVAPIGFVCDHVEILYDIDIEAKQIAEEHGVHLERIESMNTDPLFIEAITDAICHI